MKINYIKNRTTQTNLDEQRVTSFVRGLVSALPEGRVFPIEVQSVEAVFAQEGDGAANETPPVLCGFDQSRESPRSFVPSPDGQQGLQTWIERLEIDEAAVVA